MDKNTSDSLKLYAIDSEYVKYLQQFDPNVKDNTKNGRIRPYTGVVFEIDRFKYYIPLCSPKPKHNNMQDKLDFIKIQDGNELKAVLNISNMIPVLDTQISLIDIEKEETTYQDLLNKEHIIIKKKADKIIKNANILYKKTTEQREFNENLAKRCADFKKLEEKCSGYGQAKTMEKGLVEAVKIIEQSATASE